MLSEPVGMVLARHSSLSCNKRLSFWATDGKAERSRRVALDLAFTAKNHDLQD